MPVEALCASYASTPAVLLWYYWVTLEALQCATGLSFLLFVVRFNVALWSWSLSSACVLLSWLPGLACVLLSWSPGLACAPESWTRAGHLAAKILRKHARTEASGALASTTRALLHIFHRDEPDSSHCSLLGLG